MIVKVEDTGERRVYVEDHGLTRILNFASLGCQEVLHHNLDGHRGNEIVARHMSGIGAIGFGNNNTCHLGSIADKLLVLVPEEEFGGIRAIWLRSSQVFEPRVYPNIG